MRAFLSSQQSQGTWSCRSATCFQGHLPVQACPATLADRSLPLIVCTSPVRELASSWKPIAATWGTMTALYCRAGASGRGSPVVVDSSRPAFPALKAYLRAKSPSRTAQRELNDDPEIAACHGVSALQRRFEAGLLLEGNVAALQRQFGDLGHSRWVANSKDVVVAGIRERWQHKSLMLQGEDGCLG